MARNDPTPTNKQPKPIKPIAPEADKAAAQVPVIDTAKLSGAEQDPRGENRPGVLPDPKQDDIDPITNLRLSQLDPKTGGPLPNALQPPAINEPPTDGTEDGGSDGSLPAKPPSGKMRMIATSDIWPTEKPKGWPEGQEYRVRTGETVDLPRKEAFARMEAGTAKRANPTDE